ncbi:hypothetical protein XAC301_32630 [Xanthomonas arboricola pv. corylina]|uniref:HTH cro/C1-type domain-containing protein n=1 Tax=Xanthomonas arboricola pv. corylina TaxID=487821 RepID=A0ABM8SL86_9XANT|nr:hypothetical protein XAC301_32630 [Xanthomonas arboricola pv. corylina]CAE6816587.1 hypothetical protein XAC301_32630 [Xanthomonas arboricola pv. corylina]
MNPRNRGLGGHSPQHVQALLNQGLTQRALAERVGVTHQAVSRFVRRHGLLSGGLQAYRSRQADQVAQRRRQVRQLLKEGRTSAEVAARLGVSIAMVSLDRQALGLGGAPIRSKQRTLCGLTRGQVQARLKAVSRAQLARELGVSSSAVYRFCKKTGLISS